MDFDQLYPNRFLKAGEFAGKDVTLTISGVKVEKLGEGEDAKIKAVLAFQKTAKEMVLNRTNGECIKAMFGRQTDAWMGKRVTFFPATITDAFTGELILAIRVRGSPDIAEPKTFNAKIGRKTINFCMKPTGKGSNGQAAAAPPPPPAVPTPSPSPLPDDVPF